MLAMIPRPSMKIRDIFVRLGMARSLMMKKGRSALTQSLNIWKVLPTRLTVTSLPRPFEPYVQEPLQKS